MVKQNEECKKNQSVLSLLFASVIYRGDEGMLSNGIKRDECDDEC